MNNNRKILLPSDGILEDDLFAGLGDPEEASFLDYYPSWLAPAQADKLFERLGRELAWHQGQLAMFGRQVAIPRLQAWYGDAHCHYGYSGVSLRPLPWHPWLARLKDSLNDRVGFRFNCVLANLYRDHCDSVSWHRDDEPELGPRPVIASISLGAEREFVVRHQQSRAKVSLALAHGSLLIMHAPAPGWEHALLKQREVCGPRINLTFRHIP